MIKSAKGIIFLNNKYLLQLRDNKKYIFFPNFWGLFGGGLDKNETQRQAVEREIEEETNLIVKAFRKILSVNFSVITLKKKRQITYFECKVIRKTKIILTEGQKYKFFTFKQIKRLNIIPMDYVAISSHHYRLIQHASKNR